MLDIRQVLEARYPNHLEQDGGAVYRHAVCLRAGHAAVPAAGAGTGAQLCPAPLPDPAQPGLPVAGHRRLPAPVPGLPLDIEPRSPFTSPTGLQPLFAADRGPADAERDFKVLQERLAASGLRVPTLFNHYAQVAEPAGVAITAFNVDRDFGNCVDGFVLVDLEQLKPRKRRRYLECGNGGGNSVLEPD